jgi:hypothetical protein
MTNVLHFSDRFYFGLLDLIQYSRSAILLVLRAAFFFPEPYPTLQGGALALLAKSKIANCRLSNTRHKHPSAPHALLCPVSQRSFSRYAV